MLYFFVFSTIVFCYISVYHCVLLVFMVWCLQSWWMNYTPPVSFVIRGMLWWLLMYHCCPLRLWSDLKYPVYTLKTIFVHIILPNISETLLLKWKVINLLLRKVFFIIIPNVFFLEKCLNHILPEFTSFHPQESAHKI